MPNLAARIGLTILLLHHAAHASEANCGNACETPLAQLQFEGSSLADGPYDIQCQNRLHVQSLFICIRAYCNEREVQAGLLELSENCRLYGSTRLLPWSIINNISDQEAQSWPHIGVKDLGVDEVHDSPVFVTQGLYSIALRTTTAWDLGLVTRANYGYAMYWFFAIVFLVSLATHTVDYIIELRRQHHYSRYSVKQSTLRLLRLTAKRYLTTPALFSYHTAKPIGWFTVPRRVHSLTIAAFVVVNVVLCCVSYDIFEGNLYWPDMRAQFWRYFSDRTGVISMCNLPLVFAFGMRNNVLSWLTGWNFTTFNMFHRWVARVATVEAILHSIGYTIEVLLEGGKDEYLSEWNDRYWWMGAVATIVMSLLCVFSIYPIRQNVYELFLIVHIILAIVSLIGMWYHVEIFNSEYTPFVWPSAAVWVLDRVLRLGRVCYLNRTSFSATASYCPDADLVRLHVPVRSHHRPRPSNCYYLYGLDGARPWESHPFTLSTWSSTDALEDELTLTFLIRPYDSFTGRLRRRLLLDQKRSAVRTTYGASNGDLVSPVETQIRVAVEGPYGHPISLARHGSILFIMGGTGITVALAHIQALHEDLMAERMEKFGLCQIHLVWAVRDEALYQDVYKHELAPWFASSLLTAELGFQIDVYITRNSSGNHKNKSLHDDTPLLSPVKLSGGAEPSSTATELLSQQNPATADHHLSNDGMYKHSAALTCSPSISVFKQRPSAYEIVLTAAQTWCVRGERLAVVSCGPASMADDTRAAVVAAYSHGYEGVDLFAESFNW